MHTVSTKIAQKLIIGVLVSSLGLLGYMGYTKVTNQFRIVESAEIVKTTNTADRISTDEMYYGCRAKAKVAIDDTLTRLLAVPTDNYGESFQVFQNLGNAFGLLHGCEVLMAATLVNEESRQKITPKF